MGPVTLAIALYAALIGTIAFAISVYDLVLHKSESQERIVQVPYSQGRGNAKELDKGIPSFTGMTPEDLGQPAVFDPDRIESDPEEFFS